MPQPDDAVAVYHDDPGALDALFFDAFGRQAQVGDRITVGTARWRRIDDDRWQQDPIAGVRFTKGRR